MIKFKTTRWEGIKGLDRRLLALLRPKAERAVFDAALHYANELKRTLSGRRSGLPYKVSKTGELHIASAPGEPPAVLFDHLRGSVGFTDPKWSGLSIGSLVGPGLGGSAQDQDISRAYAPRMEYGGSDSRGVYIAPRPYMAPTAARVEPQIEVIFMRALS